MNKEKRDLGFVQWALSLEYEVQRKKYVCNDVKT